MGSVDVIPGISGGTIAFITGIYHDLIKSIDRFSFKKLIKGQFRILWEDVNGSFLLSLFLGIITGVFFLSGILIYLFRYHPISISAFLFSVFFKVLSSSESAISLPFRANWFLSISI